MSSTGVEYEKDIILEIVSSDLNLVTEEPGLFQQHGRKVIVGLIITVIGGIFIYGIIKKS